MAGLSPSEVTDAASLQEFMSEPAERLVAAATRIDGPVLVLGGSGKMGPDLVRTLRRADLAAGVRRDIAVASTFSDPGTRAELEAGRASAASAATCPIPRCCRRCPMPRT